MLIGHSYLHTFVSERFSLHNPSKMNVSQLMETINTTLVYIHF